MKDHIDKLREGMEKIKDGFSMMSGGPASFTLDCLLAAYRTLTEEYATFRVGQRVTVCDGYVPPEGLKHDRHFMVPSNAATVCHVSVSTDGHLRYEVTFDRETWIDRDGVEKPVIQKHRYTFFEKELQGVPVELRRA